MSSNQDLESIFGERAKFSEYAVGQTVRYVSDGRVQVGEITWTTPADDTHPLEYWVNGLTCLYQNDILGLVEEEEEDVCPGCGHPKRLHPHTNPDLAGLLCNSWYRKDDEEDTAILVHCPYCHTTHAVEAVQWCRQRYGK